MKLKRLGNRLQVLPTNRVKAIAPKAGATARTRGYAWMKIRRAVLVASNYACSMCGYVSFSNEIDHITPLEYGGTDAIENLQVLCHQCHSAKTTEQARTR